MSLWRNIRQAVAGIRVGPLTSAQISSYDAAVDGDGDDQSGLVLHDSDRDILVVRNAADTSFRSVHDDWHADDGGGGAGTGVPGDPGSDSALLKRTGSFYTEGRMGNSDGSLTAALPSSAVQVIYHKRVSATSTEIEQFAAFENGELGSGMVETNSFEATPTAFALDEARAEGPLSFRIPIRWRGLIFSASITALQGPVGADATFNLTIRNQADALVHTLGSLTFPSGSPSTSADFLEFTSNKEAQGAWGTTIGATNSQHTLRIEPDAGASPGVTRWPIGVSGLVFGAIVERNNG